jgi:hypothetical protein
MASNEEIDQSIRPQSHRKNGPKRATWKGSPTGSDRNCRDPARETGTHTPVKISPHSNSGANSASLTFNSDSESLSFVVCQGTWGLYLAE